MSPALKIAIVSSFLAAAVNSPVGAQSIERGPDGLFTQPLCAAEAVILKISKDSNKVEPTMITGATKEWKLRVLAQKNEGVWVPNGTWITIGTSLKSDAKPGEVCITSKNGSGSLTSKMRDSVVYKSTGMATASNDQIIAEMLGQTSQGPAGSTIVVAAAKPSPQ